LASREVITDIGEGRDWYVRQFYEYCNLIEGESRHAIPIR